ncbi:hypothetical protein CB1_000465029 [Camelus ferus]|nr:hypothetical protein CB1_000465029 [Camelus ferus]
MCSRRGGRSQRRLTRHISHLLTVYPCLVRGTREANLHSQGHKAERDWLPSCLYQLGCGPHEGCGYAVNCTHTFTSIHGTEHARLLPDKKER